MATFYEDNTRRIVFDERARRFGPLDGPEKCQVDLLEWSPGDNIATPPLIETNAQALRTRHRPRVQIVFAPLDVAYYKFGAGIQALFDHYCIPSDFISQRLESVTHSFNATFDKSSCLSWFHFLCKNVTIDSIPGRTIRVADPRGTELSHGDWTWIRTSVFMRWSDFHNENKASVTLVIFSASPELRDRWQRLWQTDLSTILVDPFNTFAIIQDELWRQALGIVTIVGEVFGKMERTALNLALPKPPERDGDHHDFVGLHNIAKHIIHLKEDSDAAFLTMGHLREFHKELMQQPPQGQAAIPTMRLTDQMLAQKSVQFEVWRLRIHSLEQRMQNVINLSFNLVTQEDSRILKDDSKSMKAIAGVTVAFLPLATIAAVFGSQFFNFDSQSRKILVADDFWIFWALIGALSLAVSLLYYYLYYFRGRKRDSLPEILKLKHLMSS